MDDQRIKGAVLAAIERTVDAHELAEVVRALARGPRPTLDDGVEPAPTGLTPAASGAPTAGSQRLLTRIVLGDILDDAILGARPQDRTFPLRLFFSELGRLLATDADDGPSAHAADLAFTLASGLNFFFRASMDDESKMRVGLEVSRQLYAMAHASGMDAELLGKAAPLLAALMASQLERLKFESIDHMKLFDSQLHERAAGADPSGSRIVRPASFLCRVSANNAIKAKAQVVT
jgi:hypothetical protein